MYGGVTGKAGDRLPMSILAFSFLAPLGELIFTHIFC
jgi:hypothetical protein